MKFLLYSAAVTLLFATSALAQISFGSPTSGQNLVKGTPFVVELDFPEETFVAVQHVSVVIGLQTCGATACTDTGDANVGQTILYAGSYNPQKHEASKPLYQKFTFTLGSSVTVGHAKIKVSHFLLTHAGSNLASLSGTDVDVTIS